MSQYDDLVAQSMQPEPAQSARVGFAAAVDTNPDAYAEAQRIARRTGVPVDTALNMPAEMKRQDAVGSIDFSALAKTSPATAALLADVEKAKIAHDDVDGLSGIEQVLGVLKGTGTSLMSAVPKFNEGAWGLARAGADLLPDFIGKPLAGQFAQYGSQQRGIANDLVPKSDNILASSWYSGMQSLGLNLLQLPLGASGKMAPVLTSMGLTTGGQSYGEARDKGVSVPQSLAFGASQGVIEAGTEMLGMPALFGMLKPGQFGAKALEYLVKEQGGEQIATHLQDLNEWATLNPEKSFSDYLAQRPSAALQTALATAFGGGGQIALMKGVQLLAGRNEQRAQEAAPMADALAQFNQLATANKVLQRDPATFEQFIAHAAENGPAQQVFIDANALMQSGVAEQVAAASPAVAAQLETAVQTGGQIAIPVEEYATRIAPTEYAQSLVDHLKTDPEGFSRAEAQEYMQNGAHELQAEVERALTEKQGDDAFKASTEAVRTNIKSQLDTAARFTPQVNDAYSSMMGSFFAVTAARMGITPEQLYQRYPLLVGAESIAGGKEFAQGGALADLRQQWSEAGIKNAISEKNGIITLSQIVVPDGERGAGKGTSAMQELIDYADRTGQHIALSPSSDFGGNKKRLAQFYKRFGFIENKGKNRAFTTSESMYRQASGKVLEQSTPAGVFNKGAETNVRGSFNPESFQISLLKNADLSTFLHESGHFFLEVQASLAAQLQQKPADSMTAGERDLLVDMDALLKWFGVQDLTTWHALDFEEKRSYHEQFARGFEAYLFEGKAPSIETQGLFQRFRAWMLNVYKDLKALNVELNDEVRSVFDRMLATTEQIQLAEQGRSMMPLFTSPEQAGMTVEEFAAYQALGVDATNEAIQDLQARGLREMQWMHNARGREIKRLQKEAKAKRAEVEMEARREVMSQPVYRAWEFLTRKEATPDAPAGKLSRTALAEMYGGHADGKFDRYAMLDWKRLTDQRMTAEDGLHPDVAAEMLGFTSGDELVRAIVAAELPSAEIAAMTDARMLQRYGDMNSPEAIEKAADQAVHNEVRARMVAAEANALAKATGQRRVLGNAAKEFAAAMIARLKVRSIRPGQYANAEARAARAAEKASNAGDLATAAAEKRNQLIQNYATRAAYDAQEEVDKGLRYLNKFDSAATRKGLDTDYTDQIDALLERFDLRKGQSLKAVDKRAALADWLIAQREAGFEPDVPADLADEAFRKSYKDMTVEEFRGLIDTVKQIEHLGRLKNKLLTAADQRAYEAVRDEITASIHAHAGNRQADTRTPTTNTGRAVQGLKRFWASHIKAATWARVMDGGKDGGPMWEYFVRTANERGDMETTMRAEATEKLSEIMAPVFALSAGRMGGKGQFFPSIGRSLNREARIALALNTGNEGNLQRLLGGENWSVPQILPVLQSLTAQEWQAVQAVWDYFESYRPQIAAKERRIYGKEPAWVDPAPFSVTTADGATIQLRGGYYPVKYDPAASQRAEEHADAESAKRQLQGSYTTATTRRSFTKSRAEAVTGRPLLYTLSGLYSGVNDVIHDLAWHEWLIDANRLLRSSTIDSAIREHYGPEVKQQFKTWAADIAEGEKGADAAVDIALSRLRQGVSISGLGFNVMSAVMQPLGLTQSITRVGAEWIGRGVLKYAASPIDLTRQVNEMSDFMANRARTRFRELNELRNKVQSGKILGRYDEYVGHHAYFLMMRCQQMVDVPTWWGAYEKAIADGNEESRAISLADQAVIDAQGGGQTKDLAAIERGGPAQKLFTVFYSFMNTALNLGVEKTMSADTPTKKAKLAVDYAMLYVVPAVLGYFLKAALTPGGSGDDDPEKIAKKLLANQIDYLMGMMVVVREFGEAAKTVTGANDMGRDYTGPAGLRMIADTGNMAKQAHQGEFDDAFRKAAVNLTGDMLGLPSAQVNRTVTGAKALVKGETSNPAAVIFGFQKPR